jgi:glycosyltransferase involved in cell wall biosynthesis
MNPLWTKEKKKHSEKILVYGQNPPPYHGSNVMTGIFLESLRNIGYRALLSEKNFSRTISDVNRINIIKAVRYGRYLFKFSWDILKFRPSLIVFLTSTSPLAILAESILMFIARILDIPYILYLHTPGYADIQEKKPFLSVVVRRTFGGSLGCLVLGRNLKKEIGLFFRGKIYILANCLRDDIAPDVRARTSPLKILFLSNITKDKGILTFLNSVVPIVRKHPEVRFIVAGPWQDEKIKARAIEIVHSRGLMEHVEFMGPALGKRKEALFSSCDIFVFPSHYLREEMSLVVLEAMRAGMPVISSSIGEMADVVVDGSCGYVVPPNDASMFADKILGLIEDPVLRERIGMAARARFLELYSFESYTTNLRAILNEIFDGIRCRG